MMSGLPSSPSTPGRDSAVCSRSSRSTAVGHGQRPVADAVGAAGRVVAGDDHQPAVGRDQRGAWCGRRRPAGSPPGRWPGSRSARSYLRQERRSLAQPLSAGSTTSSVVGMAVEHSRRVATIAPAPLAKRRIFSRSQPVEQSVAEGAAEAVAGAEAVDRRHRGRRHLDDLVPGHAEHALGSLLDDGDLARRRPAAPRRPGGARSRRPRPRTPPCCRSPR